MSTFSAVVNGQLVPVAPANAVVAPPAPQPVISSGAYASNLPGFSLMGGATSQPMQAGAASVTASANNTVATSAAMNSGQPTGTALSLQGAIGNVWALPFWQNPLALTIILLVIGYLILRMVHWQG